MFEILQHTADVRLHVRATSVEELFRDAMIGMFVFAGAVIRDSGFGIRVAVDSVDRTSLLVDFLNEVLVRAQIQRVAFDDVGFEKLTETEVVATLHGGPAEFTQDIKAVTYHEADVKNANGIWQTMLVLDI